MIFKGAFPQARARTHTHTRAFFSLSLSHPHAHSTDYGVVGGRFLEAVGGDHLLAVFFYCNWSLWICVVGAVVFAIRGSLDGRFYRFLPDFVCRYQPSRVLQVRAVRCVVWNQTLPADFNVCFYSGLLLCDLFPFR